MVPQDTCLFDDTILYNIQVIIIIIIIIIIIVIIIIDYNKYYLIFNFIIAVFILL